MPQGQSRERLPVGTASTFRAESCPRRMTAPSPYCFLIWARAVSRALAFSSEPAARALTGALFFSAMDLSSYFPKGLLFSYYKRKAGKTHGFSPTFFEHLFSFGEYYPSSLSYPDFNPNNIRVVIPFNKPSVIIHPSMTKRYGVPTVLYPYPMFITLCPSPPDVPGVFVRKLK